MVVIGERPKRSKATPEQLAADEARLQASMMVEEQYQNFDVVWAKLGSYPWWPAVLFYSWDAVNKAGLELKTVQRQLMIPPPTMKALPDGKTRLVHSVLIMFLDKFDCNVIEVSPKTVCSFAINYERLVAVKSKHKGKAFKIALERANRLLHINDNMSVDALDAMPVYVEPTVEAEEETSVVLAGRSSGGKRQKRSHSRQAVEAEEVDEELEDAEEEDENDDDDEADDGSDYTDGEEVTALAKRRGKAPKQAKPVAAKAVASPRSAPKQAAVSKKTKDAQSKRRPVKTAAPYVESIDDDESEDFEIVNASFKAQAKSASSRKKASRKEGRIHQDVIDVDGDDDEFTMTINLASKKQNARSSSAKPPKSANAKSIVALATVDAEKKTKSKKKPRAPDSEGDVEYIPSGKTSKKKGTVKGDRHNSLPMLPDDSTPRGTTTSRAAPRPEPLTLTPLSSIWTTRDLADEPSDGSERIFTNLLAYKQALLWDGSIFTEGDAGCALAVPTPDGSEVANGGPSNGERAPGKRQVRSVQHSQIRQGLLSRNLDPHTMVQCESYLPKGGQAILEASGGGRSRGPAPQIEAPFEVVVHPDVVLVCDLHSHLATCEIIGFLGGRWIEETKTLHIQAAFPCRLLVIDGDDGSTDVEMDPESEIELREIITNAQLEVVGWYHSHPAFAPDPSVRDIDNQTSYQSLFERRKQLPTGEWEISEPFVGLIVGTFDPRRDSPVGLFRYFHTRPERVNPGMRDEVRMPYELVPRKRYYRSVLEDEKQERERHPGLYNSVAQVLSGGNKSLLAKSVTTANDAKDHQWRRGDNSQSAAVARKKKRKENVQVDVGAPQPPKKKRGRPPRTVIHKIQENPENAAQHPSASQDVIDLISDQSQDVVSPEAEQTLNTPAVSSIAATQPVISVLSSMESDHDAMVVDESSQSQVELSEPSRPSGAADAKHEEIVCDSSQSQDFELQTSITNSDAPQQQASTRFVDTSRQAPDDAMKENIVSASASSSSSLSDSSFSYDASQSQNLSQSQGEEPAVCAVVPTAAQIEDDPYADIEIIPSSYALTKISANAKHVDAGICSTIVIKGAQQIVKSSDSEIPRERMDESGDDAKDRDLVAKQDDMVDDSAPETSSSLVEESQESIAQADDAESRKSPGGNGSGMNSGVSGGSSTPIDMSLVLAGRRRTRKPTLIVRRRESQEASLTPTEKDEVSPRSPRSSSKIASGEHVSPISIAGEGEQRKRDDAAAWDEIEVIGEPVAVVKAQKASSVHDRTHLEDSVRDAAVPKKESTATFVSTDEKESASTVTIEMRDSAAQENLDTVELENDSGVACVSTASEVAVPVETELSDVLSAKPEMSSLAPALCDEDQTAKLTETMGLSSAIVGSGRKRAKHKDMESDGFLVEPLEKYRAKDLRAAASRLKLTANFRREGKYTKKGAIAVIRDYWQEVKLVGQVDSPDQVRPPSNRFYFPPGKVERSAVDELNVDAAVVVIPEAQAKADVTILPEAQPEPGVAIVPEAQAVLCAIIDSVVRSIALEQSDATQPANRVKVELSMEAFGTAALFEKNEPSVHMAATASAEASTVISDAPQEEVPNNKPTTLQETHQKHLLSLRSKYGPGVYGCTEQVITLIDYYRDFDRRTDLLDWWKPKITRVEKIEASLRADVEHVNVAVALRESFVQDIMGYLRASWQLSPAR